MEPKPYADIGLKKLQNLVLNKKIDQSNINIQKSAARSLIAILTSDPKFIDNLRKAKFMENNFGDQLRKIINSSNLPAFLNSFTLYEAEEVYKFIARELNGILPETAVIITESQVEKENNIKAFANSCHHKDIAVFRFQNIKKFENQQNFWRFITASMDNKKLKGLTVKKGNLSFPLIRNGNSWTLHKIFDISEYQNWEKAIIGCSELEMMPEMLIYTESQEPLEEFRITKDISDKIKILQTSIRQCDYNIPTTIKRDLPGKLRQLQQLRESARKDALQEQAQKENLIPPIGQGDILLQEQSREPCQKDASFKQVQIENLIPSLRQSDMLLPDISGSPAIFPEPKNQSSSEESNESLPDISSSLPKDEPSQIQPSKNIGIMPFNQVPFTSPQNVFTIPKAPRLPANEGMPSINSRKSFDPNDKPAQVNKNNEAPLLNIENPPKTLAESKTPFIIPKRVPSINNPATNDNDRPKSFPPQKNSSNDVYQEMPSQSVIKPLQTPSNLIAPDIEAKNQLPNLSPFPKVKAEQPQNTPYTPPNVPPQFPFQIPSKLAAQNAPYTPPTLPPQLSPQIPPQMTTPFVPPTVPPFQGPPKLPNQAQPYAPPPLPPQQPLQFPPQMTALSKPFGFQIPKKNAPDSFDANIGAKTVESDSESESESENDEESDYEEESSKSEEEIEEGDSMINSKPPIKQAPVKVDPLGVKPQQIIPQQMIPQPNNPEQIIPQQIKPQSNNPVKSPFSQSVFPKFPVVPQEVQPSQEQPRNIPQKFVPKDGPQVNIPKKEEAKLLTPFKNIESNPQPPVFPKAPFNNPPMHKPHDLGYEDSKIGWVCEHCTCKNDANVYICDACAKTNDHQRALMKNK